MTVTDIQSPLARLSAEQIEELGKEFDALHDEVFADLEAALQGDDLADVGRVVGAAGRLDVAADGVELPAEGLDVGLGQVGELHDVGDGHDGGSFRVVGPERLLEPCT